MKIRFEVRYATKHSIVTLKLRVNWNGTGQLDQHENVRVLKLLFILLDMHSGSILGDHVIFQCL